MEFLLYYLFHLHLPTMFVSSMLFEFPILSVFSLYYLFPLHLPMLILYYLGILPILLFPCILYSLRILFVLSVSSTSSYVWFSVLLEFSLYYRFPLPSISRNSPVLFYLPILWEVFLLPFVPSCSKDLEVLNNSESVIYCQTTICIDWSWCISALHSRAWREGWITNNHKMLKYLYG